MCMEFRSKTFGVITIEKDDFISAFEHLLEINNFIYYDLEWTDNGKNLSDAKRQKIYVMQCSYVATNLTYDSIKEKDNLIFDLTKTKISYDDLDYLHKEIIQFYKTIIDKLFDYIHNKHYLGIVYGNQEKVRLKEMADFIKDEDYCKKVTFINKRSLDLEYFFRDSKFSFIIKESNGNSLKALSSSFPNSRCHVNDEADFRYEDAYQINKDYASRLKNEITALEWKKENYEQHLKQHCGNDVLKTIAQMLNLYDLYYELKDL